MHVMKMHRGRIQHIRGMHTAEHIFDFTIQLTINDEDQSQIELKPLTQSAIACAMHSNSSENPGGALPAPIEGC